MNEWQDSDNLPEAETALSVSWQRQAFGAQMQRAALSAEAQRRAEWHRLIGDWLELKRSKSDSAHTERNYRNAVETWQAFLATQFIFEDDDTARTVELWEVDHSHVRAWQAALAAEACAKHGQSLSVVCVVLLLVCDPRKADRERIEIDLFTDRLGRSREIRSRPATSSGHGRRATSRRTR